MHSWKRAQGKQVVTRDEGAAIGTLNDFQFDLADRHIYGWHGPRLSPPLCKPTALSGIQFAARALLIDELIHHAINAGSVALVTTVVSFNRGATRVACSSVSG